MKTCLMNFQPAGTSYDLQKVDEIGVNISRLGVGSYAFQIPGGTFAKTFIFASQHPQFRNCVDVPIDTDETAFLNIFDMNGNPTDNIAVGGEGVGQCISIQIILAD